MAKTQPRIDANYPNEATVGDQNLRAPRPLRRRLAMLQQGFWQPIKQKAQARAAGFRQWMRKQQS
jgi:hypothetical protein